jgi:hypothetical protein
MMIAVLMNVAGHGSRAGRDDSGDPTREEAS